MVAQHMTSEDVTKKIDMAMQGAQTQDASIEEGVSDDGWNYFTMEINDAGLGIMMNSYKKNMSITFNVPLTGGEQQPVSIEHLKEMSSVVQSSLETELSTNESVTPIAAVVGGIDISKAAPLEGSADAPVTIIEFGDFQCPKCDQWFQNEKPMIVEDYIDTNKAKLYFVDFPFLGEDSYTAANASYCAEDQDMYWEYHSNLYNNQAGINEDWANIDNLKQFAVDLGLDTVEFNECMDSNKHADKVSYNKQVGLSHGVEGTPAFFIVGSDGTTERIDGPQSSSIFAEVIDSMPGVPSEKIVMTQTGKSSDVRETGTADPPLSFYGKGIITGEHFNGGVIWMAVKGDTMTYIVQWEDSRTKITSTVAQSSECESTFQICLDRKVTDNDQSGGLEIGDTQLTKIDAVNKRQTMTGTSGFFDGLEIVIDFTKIYDKTK